VHQCDMEDGEDGKGRGKGRDFLREIVDAAKGEKRGLKIGEVFTQTGLTGLREGVLLIQRYHGGQALTSLCLSGIILTTLRTDGKAS
jgi:hypothetical protein